jgi:hypothetical protein
MQITQLLQLRLNKHECSFLAQWYELYYTVLFLTCMVPNTNPTTDSIKLLRKMKH